MTAFRDQPIIMKARLMTVALLLAFIAAILITFGTYWYLGSRRSIIDDADTRAEAAAAEIDGTLRSITEDFVSTFGTDAFALEFSDIMERRADTTSFLHSESAAIWPTRSGARYSDSSLPVMSSGSMRFTATRFDLVRRPTHSCAESSKYT